MFNEYAQTRQQPRLKVIFFETTKTSEVKPKDFLKDK